MIKINKDFEQIPASLLSPLTKKRLKEIIDNQGYKQEAIYRTRYAHRDIKEALESIYHHKCAFCETKSEVLEVEHFRNKAGENAYYWLVYSWDNLLLACKMCNSYKSSQFEILGERVAFDVKDVQSIHSLGDKYDEQEQPKLINPEKEAIEDILIFKQDGTITSSDERIQYTIKTCQLNRKKLKNKRKRVYDKLAKKILAKYYEYKRTGNKEHFFKAKGTKEDFIEDTEDLNTEFLAFRRYILKNWE